MRFDNPNQEPDEETMKNVHILYVDEDGDKITISSDEELSDAFMQFVDKTPSVVRAIFKSNIGCMQGHGHGHGKMHCKHRGIWKQRVTHLEEKVESMVMEIRDLQRSHGHHNMNMQNKPKPYLAELKNTVECNQEEDTVENVNKTEGVTTTCSQTVDPDPVPVCKLFAGEGANMEAYYDEELKQWMFHGDNPAEVVKPSAPLPTKPVTKENNTPAPPVPSAPVQVPQSKAPKQFNLECFDPNFIHGRHTCDGCFTTPIIGYRFNATNLPDYDVCHKCFQKYKGSDILFQPEQLERDEHLQKRWKARRAKAAANKNKVEEERLRRCEYKKRNNVAVDTVDRALNEAIRRSLMEESKRNMPPATSRSENKTSANAVTVVKSPATVKSDTTPKQAGTQTLAADLESSVPELVQAEPKESSHLGEANVIVAPSNPPQVITSPRVLMEPIVDFRINKPQLEHETSLPNVEDDDLSYGGEQIIEGQYNDDDMSQTKSEDSGISWQVVDDDGNEMVAQATQMLGSALFQSDIASTDLHLTSESVSSGLTSVPTITSRSEISAVLLKRWEEELRQLHELGLLDDHANVDALGHFEAANMGVGETGPIKIDTVVDYLLKPKRDFEIV